MSGNSDLSFEFKMVFRHQSQVHTMDVLLEYIHGVHTGKTTGSKSYKDWCEVFKQQIS